jgi:hypothetical protein
VSLPNDAAQRGEDVVRVGVAAGRLLRVDELAVDDDLEDAASRRDEEELGDGVFELLEDLGRQTDGLIEVASNRAVFDRDLHDVVARPASSEASRTGRGLC